MEIEKQGSHIAEVRYRQSHPENPCRRLDADTYLYKPTGEIRAYRHREDRMQGSLTRTFRMLRGRIRANFDNGKTNQLFVTLTYAENMTDPEQLYKDFDLFYHRLKRRLYKHELAYIAVAEPQERGAWHLHILLKSLNMSVLYVPDAWVREAWGHGVTTTERLATTDDTGRYFCAYFTDLQNAQDPHKRQKAGRLHLYPNGFKFFRASRNLDKPTKTTGRYKQVKAEFGVPVATKVTILYTVVDGVRTVKNVMFYALFNKNRKDKPHDCHKNIAFVDISPPDGAGKK